MRRNRSTSDTSRWGPSRLPLTQISSSKSCLLKIYIRTEDWVCIACSRPTWPLITMIGVLRIIIVIFWFILHILLGVALWLNLGLHSIFVHMVEVCCGWASLSLFPLLLTVFGPLIWLFLKMFLLHLTFEHYFADLAKFTYRILGGEKISHSLDHPGQG